LISEITPLACSFPAIVKKGNPAGAIKMETGNFIITNYCI